MNLATHSAGSRNLQVLEPQPDAAVISKVLMVPWWRTSDGAGGAADQPRARPGHGHPPSCRVDHRGALEGGRATGYLLAPMLLGTFIVLGIGIVGVFSVLAGRGEVVP
jgi:hypothetical protein